MVAGRRAAFQGHLLVATTRLASFTIALVLAASGCSAASDDVDRAPARAVRSDGNRGSGGQGGALGSGGAADAGTGSDAATGSSYSFVVFGDSQFDPTSCTSGVPERLAIPAAIRAVNPAFIMQAGDSDALRK